MSKAFLPKTSLFWLPTLMVLMRKPMVSQKRVIRQLHKATERYTDVEIQSLKQTHH